MFGRLRDFTRLAAYIKPYRWRLVITILISLAGTLMGLVQPYLSKYLVDGALLRKDRHALLLASVLMLASTVLSFAMNYWSAFHYMRLSSSMLFDMRLAVYRHVLTLSPRFFAKARLGDLVSRLNGDVAEVQRISADLLLSVLSNSLFLIGSLCLMLWLSWRLFIAGVLLVPVAAVLFQFCQVRIAALALQLRERSADIGTAFVETLLANRLVGCLFSHEFELERFRIRNDAFIATLLRFQRLSICGRSFPGFLLSAATVAVFLYGGREIIAGHITIGTLVAFMAYQARLMSPVQSFMGLSTAVTTARVSLGRVLELLDTPPEIVDCSNPRDLSAVRDNIRFHEVTLCHEGRTVLDKASFDIQAGSLTVLMGESGGGKSTVADLLVRLLDPDSGSVSIDGTDLRSFRLAHLRRTVVLIDQTPALLHGALFDNIAYANPGVTTDSVSMAARAAGLATLIAKLPEGLNTLVGERGSTLSAGERQRVAIARSFLADPDVLILDEPTAALDRATGRELLRNIRARFRDKTVIVITHKLIEHLDVDRLLLIEAGKVTEAGVLA